jgi:hypothetical protein
MRKVVSVSGLGIGNFILNIAVALYLFANGIIGITQKTFFGNPGGDFGKMVRTIFSSRDMSDLANVITIILSVCAIAAGIFLLMQLFKVVIPITDLILFVFIILWAVFIVLVNIIAPLRDGFGDFLEYLTRLSAHLMVLGALISSSKRFA